MDAPPHPPAAAASASSQLGKRTLEDSLLEEDDEDDLREMGFICPITQEVFREPVVAADGHTYEREAIEDWLDRKSTSPVTNEPMQSRTFRANISLHAAIQKFAESRKERAKQRRLMDEARKEVSSKNEELATTKARLTDVESELRRTKQLLSSAEKEIQDHLRKRLENDNLLLQARADLLQEQKNIITLRAELEKQLLQEIHARSQLELLLRRFQSEIASSLHQVPPPVVSSPPPADNQSAALLMELAEKLMEDNKPEEAAKFYQKAADKGLAAAQFALSRCLRKGIGVPVDLKSAYEWCQKAAEQKFAKAERKLGDMIAEGLGTEKAEGGWIEWYEKAIEHGDSVAMMLLGAALYEGSDGAQEDKERGERLLQQAVQFNNTEAMVKLGEIRENEEENEAAFELYNKAHEAGDANGSFKLAVCYLDGVGVEIDTPKGIELLSLAAEKQHVDALIELADCYITGKEAPKDADKAFELISRAAKLDDRPSIACILGLCYVEGVGGVVDMEQGIANLRKAAAQKHATAQRKLGEFYLRGWGLPKNVPLARQYLQYAAEQDDAVAKKLLATLPPLPSVDETNKATPTKETPPKESASSQEK